MLLIQRVSHLAFWSQPGYLPLWAAQRVVLLLFWLATTFYALGAFNIRYFDPEALLGRDQKAGGGGGAGWEARAVQRTPGRAGVAAPDGLQDGPPCLGKAAWWSGGMWRCGSARKWLAECLRARACLRPGSSAGR